MKDDYLHFSVASFTYIFLVYIIWETVMDTNTDYSLKRTYIV